MFKQVNYQARYRARRVWWHACATKYNYGSLVSRVDSRTAATVVAKLYQIHRCKQTRWSVFQWGLQVDKCRSSSVTVGITSELVQGGNA